MGWFPTKSDSQCIRKWWRSSYRLYAYCRFLSLLTITYSQHFQIGKDIGGDIELEDDSEECVDIARFKREVYHKILEVMFATLIDPANPLSFTASVPLQFFG